MKPTQNNKVRNQEKQIQRKNVQEIRRASKKQMAVDNNKKEANYKLYRVPGNEITVEEAFKETILEPRDKVYKQFAKIVNFLHDFLNVDLEEYEKLNFKTFGHTEKKYKYPALVPEVKKNEFGVINPNLTVWLYSQVLQNNDFFYLRAFVNTSYSFVPFKKEAKTAESNGALFFGSRIGYCKMDMEIFNKWETLHTQKKPDPQLNFSQEITHRASNGETFQFLVTTAGNINYVSLVVSMTESEAQQAAKREFIEHQTKLQLSKKMLQNLGSFGRTNINDSCYFDVGLEGKNAKITYVFRVNTITSSFSDFIQNSLNITKNCKRHTNVILNSTFLG